MPTLDELFEQVDAQRDEIVALEQALVRIPSVNTGFMPTGNETPVCEYIRDWLAVDSIESEILEASPNRGNIISSIPGTSGDTVTATCTVTRLIAEKRFIEMDTVCSVGGEVVLDGQATILVPSKVKAN